MAELEPIVMIDAYGKIIEEDPELVEFLYLVNEKNSLRIKNLSGRFLDIYNALVNLGFLASEHPENEANKNTRIVFTTDIGRAFWDKYGHRVEILNQISVNQ